MILGNAAWGFRETPLERRLEITRDMGFNLLELQIAGHENDFLQLDASDEAISEVKELFKKYSINLVCASTGNDFTGADEAESISGMESIKKVIDIAQKLEIKYLRIFAGFSPVDEVTGTRWAFMIKMLNEVLEYGAKHHVLPSIETHGGVEEYLDGIRHFASTSTVIEKLNKIFSELKYPFGIVFDPANLGAVGMNEDEIIALYQELGEKIAYFHLKDFSLNRSGALQPCACGDGQLDWNKLMTKFDEFTGPGMIEYELTEDITAGLKRSQVLLQNQFALAV
ncbi:MAG: sugar phosphate isomerase/epimerase [Victivallaceae bacterium]|nr:sugar phosphate isomerase/epimerase [Victivallaceae bacterium]